MFGPHELPSLRNALREASARDKHILDELRKEARDRLSREVKVIRPRSTTSVSMVASDGGNNRLEFDPFNFQLVRVMDSFGEQLCVDIVTPTTDTDKLSEAQFGEDGSPKTALGRVMRDLKVRPLTLNGLSPMIPDGETVRKNPERVSRSWVQVYRDLCEWAALYEQIRYRDFATDTLVVRDGLLRSKLFRGELFTRLCKLVRQSIEERYDSTRRKIFLVGIAKRSRVLERYNLAMELEKIFPPGEPRYVEIPRELEAKAYVWPEYARGMEEDGEDGEGKKGEAPKFVAGKMFFVRFGKRAADPVWPVDIFESQSGRAAEVFGYLLADAVEGFPVPFYPGCLQKAHEHASVGGLDLDIIQSEVFSAIRGILSEEETPVLDGLRLREDVSERRYG